MAAREPKGTAISSATLQWWAWRDSHGDEAPRGLSSSEGCFWPESAVPPKGRPRWSQLGNCPVRNAFCWGWLSVSARGGGLRMTERNPLVFIQGSWLWEVI